MTITVPQAELFGTLLESMVYGANFISFLRCSHVLHVKYAEGRSMFPFFAAALAIFVLITMHLVVDWIRAMRAFTDSMAEPDAPALFFRTVNSLLDITKTAIYVAVTLIADLLIVYRTYLVWGRSYLAATIPFLLFIVDIAMSTWATWSLTQTRVSDDVLLANVTIRAKYFYAVTLSLNLLCTFLISYRIWSIHLLVGGTTLSDRLSRVVHILIESASCYSALLLVLIITSATGSPALFIVLNSTAPVIGVVFSAIIIGSLENEPSRTAADSVVSARPFSTVFDYSVHVRLGHAIHSDQHTGGRKSLSDSAISSIV
ncbi:hypothetical protein OBBRIDRAFT_828485 [Obba rivulosa]|uniref:Uncharacterized protein n=1 Tax=Obba rivulosa TaxID=1052685 RepID=A0A8E2AVI8_9APHY|nr:hypothetical protein OBBRIDRAFT_828485 [Obba rivulosa]